MRQLCYFIMLFLVCQELFLNSSKLLSTLVLFNSFSILSHLFCFVKNFFFLFCKKRRRRDLNPRAAINDLLPFQGSPFGQLGYFSKRPRFVICISQITISHFRALYQVLTFLSKSLVHYIALSIYLSSTFFKFFNFLNLTSGESGIRTHAPLRTNGFQDRLVMTTSISLHMLFTVVRLRYSFSARCILSSFISYVNNKFHIFS